MRAKVELERPRPLQMRICAHTGNVEQTELVDSGGEKHRQPVALRTLPGKLGRRLERRESVEIAFVPRYYRAGFVLLAAGRIKWLKPDGTVNPQREPFFGDPEFSPLTYTAGSRNNKSAASL